MQIIIINIVIDINEKDGDGNFPLIKAIDKNNIEIVKLLMDYADHNNIELNINEKRWRG